jgi:pimeloyl-ACP methyl ester carboxylesterase
LLVAGGSVLAAGAATWSFAAGERGSHPRTITVKDDKIEVDLSALPSGARVFRAVLHCQRRDVRPQMRPEDEPLIAAADKPNAALPLQPPRFTSFEATDAVRRAVGAGATRVRLLVRSLSGWKPETLRLDVSFVGGGGAGALPNVTDLAARHVEGQTLLTWREFDPPTTEQAITIRQYREMRRNLDKRRELRYRIYRAAEPITAATIAKAELVDEIGNLSGWNHNYHGVHGRYQKALDVKMRRYVVQDGKPPVPTGTAIYAHNPAKAGKACYAVTVAVNGAEDFAALGEGNATAGPLGETVGPGPFVLQRVEKPETFHYTKGVTLHYYVRWESGARSSLPSWPLDYLAAVPPKPLDPAPLMVALHCWGGSLRGGYGSYGGHAKKGVMLAATNQIPYDWWVSYHEFRGTWRPWAKGVCRDFTIRRVFAFVEWVKAKWRIDEDRTFLQGGSMGGSGASMLALRYPDRFSHSISSVGIHNAAKSPGFRGSYEGCVGQVKFNLPHESGLKVFEYLSNVRLLKADPARDMPVLFFGNGKEDHGIGWPQAVEFIHALQEARQPHTFGWGLGGHTAPLYVPPVDVRRDQSVPAFTRCSLDDNPGTATKRDKPFIKKEGRYTRKDIYDGDPYGQINAYLAWETKDVVDRKDRWEMTVYLYESRRRKPPKDGCTVDITPRRCQRFAAKAGEQFKWTNTSVADGKVIQSGTADADRWGLVTLKGVTVTTGKHRIAIRR